MLSQAVIHVLYTIRCEWNLVLTCGQGRLLLTHNMTCFLIDNLACDTLQFYQSYVSALLYEDSLAQHYFTADGRLYIQLLNTVAQTLDT